MTGKRKSGGRPSKEQSGLIEEQILDAATKLFLDQGYGETSIEQVAAACRMSKRTFYHRFDNKEALFAAVVHRLIERLRPADTEHLFEGETLQAILLKLAETLLHAALAPQALALHRLLLAEGARFPQLASVMAAEGSRKYAVTHIAELLRKEAQARRIFIDDAEFAAEQFMQMIISIPQRLALGSDRRMTPQELALWAEKSVQLFLHGCRAG
jgi:AcrR family transcriptional regulator